MRKFYLVIFLFFLAGTLAAQIPPGDPNDGEAPGVPISGIEWLLLSGGLLGARKVYKAFKKN